MHWQEDMNVYGVSKGTHDMVKHAIWNQETTMKATRAGGSIRLLLGHLHPSNYADSKVEAGELKVLIREATVAGRSSLAHRPGHSRN